MTLRSLFTLMALTLAQLGLGADLGTEINTQEWMATLRGDYVVDLVNGETPHDAAGAQAKIFPDEEGTTEYFAFSYCYPDHGCLNGPEFPYAKTKTYRKELGVGHTLHTMLIKLSTKTLKVEWEAQGNQFTLRQFDLKLGGVPPFNVVHNCHK